MEKNNKEDQNIKELIKALESIDMTLITISDYLREILREMKGGLKN